MMRSSLRTLHRIARAPAASLFHVRMIPPVRRIHHARSAWWMMSGLGKEKESPQRSFDTTPDQYLCLPDTVHAPARTTVERFTQSAPSAAEQPFSG